MAKLYQVIVMIKLAVFCFLFSLAVYVILTSARAEATPVNSLCDNYPDTDARSEISDLINNEDCNFLNKCYFK